MCFFRFSLFVGVFVLLCVTGHAVERTPPTVGTQDGQSVDISVSGQTLTLLRNGKALRVYDISTSKYGAGNRMRSEKTPLGRHRVARKIGGGAPLGAIFRNRVYTGKVSALNHSDQPSSEDRITSRILWLEGLEPGFNRGGRVDSFKRFIYIHGTSDEGLIGRPASHGCVRMKNADVIELFDAIKVGTPVLIRQ